MVTQTNLPGTQTSDRGSGAQIVDVGPGTSNGPFPKVMDAATLSGESVVNLASEDLGKIETIMLDIACGRIAYAVVASGGFLGMGRKLFAIPWGALTVDAAQKRFILDASKEKLENAEGFDKNRWPPMTDRAWASRLHSYYGVAPYWNDEDGSEDLVGLPTEAARPIGADRAISGN